MVIHVRDCVKVCSSEGLENVGKIMRLYYDKLESKCIPLGKKDQAFFTVKKFLRLAVSNDLTDLQYCLMEVQ